ncbi:hypothetical protein COCVIDRAFT_104852 [Bipolaris victoriae FI3]|uniref:G-protein coupled receptors family 1 profile domain-containing protein n=1 Tax=Bipolaris victoriae (strain FI3) TaxID=930091 RepID=W7E3F7_BIPV3|nr:hypothetical protein COCVIDRAFT_104852 [Bipolaris victoriae FI3]
MMLVTSGAILVYGLNLTTWKQCRASITVCLFLYFSSKILLYIFYLERIHIARQPLARRCDTIWIGGMVMTVGFFGGMAVWCIATPHSAISVHDGHCRIGSDMIPSYTTFSTDIVINFSLTGVFIWLILPILKNQARGPATVLDEFVRPSALGPSGLRRVLRSNVERDDPLASSVKKMLRRNIIGSLLTFAAGAINLIIYFVDATSQIAFVCYTMCIVDVVFGVLVVQWLTFGSHEPDMNFNPPPGAANLTNLHMAYAANRTLPERINTPTKESRPESRCDINFITMPRNLGT